MTCRYCNHALSPLRSLIDGEFCSDGHRMAFEAGNPASFPVAVKATREDPVETPAKAALVSDAEPVLPQAEYLLALGLEPQMASLEIQQFDAAPTVEFHVAPPLLPYVEFSPSDVMADLAAITEPVPTEEPVASAAITAPALAEVAAPQESAAPEPVAFEASEEGEEPVETRPNGFSRSWNWVAASWRSAPLDLKVITLCLPAMLAVALSGSRPQMKFTSSVAANNVQQVVSEKWKVVQQNIAERAAVAYTDDFRAGLDSWDSTSNLTTSWSYDATGFVQPGPLAVFKPTMDMTDYRFGFLGEIDRKALGFVFRATDLNNYYAVKFVVVRPGPLPLVDVVRYAVINGKEGPRVEKPLPITALADMLYRVIIDVHGGDFTIMAQDQVVDFWSDHRLQKGGVGFFCNRGEKARLRWVEVSHQYDALGKLCAFVAPYGMQSSTD